jgi:hypothetical protein
MKKINKKAIELTLSKTIWFIILGITFIVMVAWYLAIRGKIDLNLGSILG